MVGKDGGSLPITTTYRELRKSGAKWEPMDLTEDALNTTAGLYLRTGTMPALGMGASKARKEILNRAGKMAKDAGQSLEDIIAGRVKFKGRLASATSMATNARIEDKKVNTASHIMTMIDKAYNKNDGIYYISSSMHQEMAMAMATLVSPVGTPSEHTIDELRQGTAREAMSKFLVWSGLDPKKIGGTTQSVTKLFIEQVKRQGEMSVKLRDVYKSGSQPDLWVPDHLKKGQGGKIDERGKKALRSKYVY